MSTGSPEVYCDTSPLQYLHQLGLLDVLPALCGQVTVPPAVLAELGEGRARGLDLPDPAQLTWVAVRRPVSTPALSLAHDLGPGEAAVLALALEMPGSTAVLDDLLARRLAARLGLRLTGTLGLLLDAKAMGLVSCVAPLLDRLQALRFRVSPPTRAAVLTLASET